MGSPRIFALQALQLIDHAIQLHDTNRSLYDQAHYARWCKQEIKKASLVLVAQVLREHYLEEQGQGPVLPLLERSLPDRSIARINPR